MKKLIFILLFYTNYIIAQQPLNSLNKLTQSGRVSIGEQPNGDIRPNSGVFRVIDTVGNYMDLTQYQYGGTLRTNRSIIELFIGDDATSPGHFSVRKNLGYTGATRYGCIINARDVDDIFSVALSAKNAHYGFASIGVVSDGVNTGSEYPNLNLILENNQSNGTIEVKVSGNSVGKFTKHGFIHAKYTTTQRDALTGVEVGTNIYNTTLNVNQVWNGTTWN